MMRTNFFMAAKLSLAPAPDLANGHAPDRFHVDTTAVITAV